MMIRNSEANVEEALENRLKKLGIEPALAPRFLKDIFNVRFVHPRATLWQIQQRLRFLGWADVELDYHTFSLARERLKGMGGGAPRYEEPLLEPYR